MARMQTRPWLPAQVGRFVMDLAGGYAASSGARLAAVLEDLVTASERSYREQCINLDPASNTMNPRAEALLARGLGSRPSLGYPGEKYEAGLESIQQIEVLAAELACEVFDADFVELRVPSGAIANLYAFMACCRPGDAVIVPPAQIGGHVTHQANGAAGLYGLEVHLAPVDEAGFSVDTEALAHMAERLRPKLISLGGSLNLFPHPIGEVRDIADAVGARVLFDGAHLSGLIAGGAWQQPLAEGAHLLTMSAYKSLAGPPCGLVLSNDPELARRIEAIAFPGLTANFDVAKSAALALTLLDWKHCGADYAAAMVATAAALAAALAERGLPVYALERGATRSHQLALRAEAWGGGQALARRLRQANLLACGIGLPADRDAPELPGLRLGTPEIVRWGMGAEHMTELAGLMAEAAGEAPGRDLAERVSALRRRFTRIGYLRD